MKRIIALILALSMVFTGCTQSKIQNKPTKPSKNQISDESSKPVVLKENKVKYKSLSDKGLLVDVEDLVYKETIDAINSEDYVVENVSAVYISKEYLEEVAFNSKSNVYFGYSLAELNEVFKGDSYIFTLGDDGKTAVKKLQSIDDKATETMIRNVAIGTGVILVCVTVSAVSAGPAPALSMIFAASAKSASKFAASSAAFGGISRGLVKGIETGDFGEIKEAAAMGASEGFKWGAIGGAVTGGAKEAFSSMSITNSKLKKGDVARIQMGNKWSMDVIKDIQDLDQYKVIKGMKEIKINGRSVLVPKNIDLNFKIKLPDGTIVTNLDRINKNLSPIEAATGFPYELHHMGQKANGTLVMLTRDQHRGNYSILHTSNKASEIDRLDFAKVRNEIWKGYVKRKLENEGI
ncbi:HNH/ENDO VII family nuclease [Anaerococcus murdochii]|uniref:HNH/ENDO VII family nuclease n=1 Tax=Anaerococcus murdochii TaxID=411577 RepID=A0ABS7SYF0_9FIRM|nr:HNH/ENDO VII family nuclease [Anaerococcus murdochii]MBZ2386565.1 HNH/ENDO VII family nuclease [Anaerococcus murdochii]